MYYWQPRRLPHYQTTIRERHFQSPPRPFRAPGLEKFLARPAGRAPHCALAKFADMKAKIIITPKKAVVDPQGKTVQGALEHMGYQGVGAVHVGKYLEIELTGTDKEAARQQIDDACHKILSNPVIEDYRFEIE